MKILISGGECYFGFLPALCNNSDDVCFKPIEPLGYTSHFYAVYWRALEARLLPSLTVLRKACLATGER